MTTLTRDGQVLVSFDVAGAYTREVRSSVQSGLETTFRYDVRLSREAPYWPDSTVGSATLAATVRYDSLIEQYNVARMVDGHVEETTVAEDENEVRHLLTRFERVPLFSTESLEPNSEYQVRVRVERRPPRCLVCLALCARLGVRRRALHFLTIGRPAPGGRGAGERSSIRTARS